MIVRIVGKARVRELTKLADEANRHYHEAVAAWRRALEHARQAGAALLEAKRLLGHRRKWSRWRHANFDASAETSRVYMRVARHWDHPRVEQARNQGIEVASINTFLKLIRGQKPADAVVTTDPESGVKVVADTCEQQTDFKRDQLRKQFAAYLRALKSIEIDVMTEDFQSLLGKMHTRLKDVVCMVLEFDYYDEDDGSRPWGTTGLRPRAPGVRLRAKVGR